MSVKEIKDGGMKFPSMGRRLHRLFTILADWDRHKRKKCEASCEYCTAEKP